MAYNIVKFLSNVVIPSGRENAIGHCLGFLRHPNRGNLKAIIPRLSIRNLSYSTLLMLKYVLVCSSRIFSYQISLYDRYHGLFNEIALAGLPTDHSANRRFLAFE